MEHGISIETHSEEETIKVAEKIAGVLEKGDIIILLGDLGAGKTHFVKGIVRGLGGNDLVTSPTFTLLNTYESGRLIVNHFDMYRLSGMEEACEIGFEEYFDRSSMNGISVVEWPSQVEGLIKAPYYQVEIKKVGGENTRKIYFGKVNK